MAGTVYNTDGTTVHPGATVRLTTAAGGAGATVITLTSDATGNFYTNAGVSYGSGLYATVATASGAVKSMGSSVKTASCNSCHSSGNRIIVG